MVSPIEAAGGNAPAVEADITDRDQAVATVADHFGRLDILTNNAGIMLVGPIVGAEIDEWERMIAVNQKGLLYMTHSAATPTPSEMDDMRNVYETDDPKHPDCLDRISA